MVYGIQFECDLDDVANGSFGPTTKANLKEKGQVFPGDSDDSSGKNFVHLFKGGYLCNNTSSLIEFNGLFDSELESAVMEFQKFAALSVNGDGDYETWCEFIVSTGDETRQTRGFDCSTNKLSSERVLELKNQGYEIGGRYIANINGGIDKCLESYEMSHMFDEGLSLFPIMQLAGADSEYFNYDNGKNDASIALQNAVNIYSIPFGTTIYFAVDYDAYEYEAETTIKEYFEGVNDYINENGSQYSVGIYASRNTCTIISSFGLATHSFVSGMSTGYSGNLGYPLPENWSFNQIAEDYDMEIDHDVFRGADMGFNSYEISDTNNRLWNYMKFIYNKALEYKPNRSTEYYNNAVFDYFRVARYGGISWDPIAGFVNTGFLNYLKEQSIPLYSQYATLNNIDPEHGKELDFPHLMVTCQGHYAHDNGLETTPNLGDFGGWCGDFVSLFAEYYVTYDYNSIEEYMEARCLVDDFDNDIETRYGLIDYISDIDAFLISKKLLTDNTKPIYTIFEEYYANEYKNRYSEFINQRLGTIDESDLYNLNYNAIYPHTGLNVLTNEYITALFASIAVRDILEISNEDKEKFAILYTQKQLSLI